MIAEDKEVTITIKTQKEKDKTPEGVSQTHKQSTSPNLQVEPQKLAGLGETDASLALSSLLPTSNLCRSSWITHMMSTD